MGVDYRCPHCFRGKKERENLLLPVIFFLLLLED
jgi:hypothetical protein